MLKSISNIDSIKMLVSSISFTVWFRHHLFNKDYSTPPKRNSGTKMRWAMTQRQASFWVGSSCIVPSNPHNPTRSSISINTHFLLLFVNCYYLALSIKKLHQ